MKGVATGTAIALICVIIATGALVLLTNGYLKHRTDQNAGQEGNGGGGISPPPSTYGAPPNVSVSLSVSSQYLGDYPEASFTVTNTGGACSISYTIFETQPQTGTFSLGEGESQTATATGPQVRDIGPYFTSVQVTATNSYGSDSAQAGTSFSVDVEPFDATPYIDINELERAVIEFSELVRGIATRLWDWAGYPADGYKRFFVTPDSETVQAVTIRLINRHPNDKELQAKEIYYWVRNWISYDMDEFYTIPGTSFKIVKNIFDYSQFELPIETLYDRKGVCLNYSLVLASMYKAAGFDVRLVILSNEGGDGHAINMLYLPNTPDVRHSPSYPDWVTLDATNNDKFGEIYADWVNSFQHIDIADI